MSTTAPVYRALEIAPLAEGSPPRRSAYLRARGHCLVRPQQHDVALLRVCPHHEHLGDERADLLRREVHDADDLPADEVTERVARRDPPARAPHPQRPE